MEIVKYKLEYDLQPNFLGCRQSGNYIFIFNLFNKPKKENYNIGCWIIKYKEL